MENFTRSFVALSIPNVVPRLGDGGAGSRLFPRFSRKPSRQTSAQLLVGSATQRTNSYFLLQSL